MKISIIGGGGTRVPILVKALLDLHDQLELTEIALFDTDRDRLGLIRTVLSSLAGEKNNEVALSYPATFRECVAGSSFVVAAIRVGGDHMR
ncbi:MAG: 6-phospho-beta-glucosidase, partial [Candidatus Cryosericum sp.]